MTPESAVILIDAAVDRMESAPVIETLGNRTRPLKIVKWADSVSPTEKLVIDYTGVYLNPISSPAYCAITQMPLMTWEVR